MTYSSRLRAWRSRRPANRSWRAPTAGTVVSRRAHQSARVNIDDAARQALHVRAIKTNRTVADELARRARGTPRSARFRGSAEVSRAAHSWRPRRR